jgi:NaMN:DMB phosphoribosyltransferase
VTVRIVLADEAVAAQSEARDAYVATVKATTRLGRIATIAIAPDRLTACWPQAEPRPRPRS